MKYYWITEIECRWVCRGCEPMGSMDSTFRVWGPQRALDPTFCQNRLLYALRRL